MSKPRKYPQAVIDDARAVTGWDDHSVITVLCDFIFMHGDVMVDGLAEYVEARIAEEEAASDEEG